LPIVFRASSLDCFHFAIIKARLLAYLGRLNLMSSSNDLKSTLKSLADNLASGNKSAALRRVKRNGILKSPEREK